MYTHYGCDNLEKRANHEAHNIAYSVFALRSMTIS